MIFIYSSVLNDVLGRKVSELADSAINGGWVLDLETAGDQFIVPKLNENRLLLYRLCN